MRRRTMCSALALLAGAALILVGCTGTVPSDVASGSSLSSSAVAPGTPLATATDGASATLSANPPEPTSPSSKPAPSPTSASLTLFYIAQDDGGTSGPVVGCGDSAVATTSPSVTFSDPVEGALRTLLENHSEEVGQSGLHNALWNSELSVSAIERSGGTVTAQLRGTLILGGECDIPRVEQQLLLTAGQAEGAPVAITINGKTLSEALSLK
ncbi:hypothetical protein AAFM46_00415 [Arthrobacter sp. TMP15]|uniref:hypothetical protein n=1 Tax=Arthrobacter sp. TMP15 TaxID=3140789 RepID=UPI0031BB398D